MHKTRGDKIKEARLKAGLSEDELAKKIQFTKKTIVRIENSQTDVYRNALLNLATALDIDVDELRDDYTQLEGLQTDKEMRLMLYISQFFFLFYPFFGVIAPYLVWMYYRQQSTGINGEARAVIRFQLLWLFLFMGWTLYQFIPRYFHSELWQIPDGTTTSIISIALYGFNIAMIVYHIIHAILRRRRERRSYQPEFQS
ncbi:MAG TPA: DUF4870 domain-containing protein [Ferruginibacter sp.]|nr:DUF4870 domain-containing protein [Ferruginibacter sp.]